MKNIDYERKYIMIDLNDFYKGLDGMFRQKNPQAIEEYMVKYLANAKGSGDLKAEIAIRNELGGFYRAAGRTDSAKENYDMVLKTLENMGMENTENYASALINTGDVYIVIGDYDRALSMFLYAKEILEKLGLGKDYRMAALSNNISAVYRAKGDFNNAEKSLTLAFEIIKNIPNTRGELAVTHINLAQLQIKQGKLDEAKENLNTAVNIFEKELGGRDVHYSQAAAALGEVYYYEGNYSLSKEWYKKAAELIKRDFGENKNYENIMKILAQVEGLEASK